MALRLLLAEVLEQVSVLAKAEMVAMEATMAVEVALVLVREQVRDQHQ